MKSCGLIAAGQLTEYHHILLLLGRLRLRSVFRIESTVQLYQVSFISFRCLGNLDGQTNKVKPHRESSCYEKFHHKNNLQSTKRKCQNSPKYQSGILEDILNNLSSKNNELDIYVLYESELSFVLIRIIQPVGGDSSCQAFNNER